MPGAPTSPSRPLAASLVVTLLAAAALLCPPPWRPRACGARRRRWTSRTGWPGRNDFTYLRTAAQVQRFVKKGYLVRVRPNADFDLHAVSFPYARPQVELFVRRAGGPVP